jgi:hypothetical protein
MSAAGVDATEVASEDWRHAPGPWTRDTEDPFLIRDAGGGCVAQVISGAALARIENAPELVEALRAVGQLLNTATYTRFGKPEWLTEEGRAAREQVRMLALRFDVVAANKSGTILGQAGAVVAAALAAAEVAL